ncbi:MAG: potassium channel family protein [Oligoflexia bacterium]|nr:potassium channel family protein [Oligoflexia bacterium]
MDSAKKDLFRAHHHIPKLFVALFRALMTPTLVYITVIGNAIMFLSAYLFYYSEKTVNAQVNTYWDALWWAICTVSTVGYGDIVPITGLGRIVGAVLIIFGVIFFLGFIAVLTSVLPSFMGQRKDFV